MINPHLWISMVCLNIVYDNYMIIIYLLDPLGLQKGRSTWSPVYSTWTREAAELGWATQLGWWRNPNGMGKWNWCSKQLGFLIIIPTVGLVLPSWNISHFLEATRNQLWIWSWIIHGYQLSIKPLSRLTMINHDYPFFRSKKMQNCHVFRNQWMNVLFHHIHIM